MPEFDSTVEYREVPGYPGYMVGSDGTVWSKWRTCLYGRIEKTYRQLKQSVKKNCGRKAYHYLNLTDVEGKVTTFRVHRLILLAFRGPCPDGWQARHLDGSPHNNALENLEWGTPEENRQDTHSHGTYRKGETHHYAKLTEKQVREIRTCYARGGVLLRDLAGKHQTTISQISNIINRRSWRHVEDRSG